MRKLDQKLHTSREEQDLLSRQIPDHQVELIMDAVENGKETLLQFPHQSHFGKKFKERFGMTPGTYRAKNAQS